MLGYRPAVGSDIAQLTVVLIGLTPGSTQAAIAAPVALMIALLPASFALAVVAV